MSSVGDEGEAKKVEAIVAFASVGSQRRSAVIACMGRREGSVVMADEKGDGLASWALDLDGDATMVQRRLRWLRQLLLSVCCSITKWERRRYGSVAGEGDVVGENLLAGARRI